MMKDCNINCKLCNNALCFFDSWGETDEKETFYEYMCYSCTNYKVIKMNDGFYSEIAYLGSTMIVNEFADNKCVIRFKHIYGAKNSPIITEFIQFNNKEELLHKIEIYEVFR